MGSGCLAPSCDAVRHEALSDVLHSSVSSQLVNNTHCYYFIKAVYLNINIYNYIYIYIYISQTLKLYTLDRRQCGVVAGPHD